MAETKLSMWEWTWLSFHVSRPLLWPVSSWFYLIPCGGHFELLHSPIFWSGLVFVTFPINLLTYAWNDMGDQNNDKINPRKGKFLMGTSNIDEHRLESIRNFAVLLNLGFAILFTLFLSLLKVLLLSFIVIGANYMYNNGPMFRRGPPPMDLLLPLGYLGLFQFSVWLNQVENLPVQTWVFHVFMALRSQLWGQIIDIRYDSIDRRKTTAIVLGLTKARMLLVFLLLCEAFSASFISDSYVLVFSFLSLMQGLVELVLYPSSAPSMSLAILTGMVMTPAGGLLFLHAIYNGIFVHD
mmetsp:Transcript_6958/g.7948  ORF Transcript_6958/g.7948 Transcript_6958/m.7948 type:complete len:296 (-) Transcript_6958:2228-3115(-)